MMGIGELYEWETTENITSDKEFKKQFYNQEKEFCSVEHFFEEERKAGRDTKICMISCKCKKCNPISL